MAKYRHVYTSFWNDPRVVEEMTPEDKYFYLYLLTNEYTTQIGIYSITKKQIAFDLGYTPETVGALIQRFITHHKIIRYNDETRELAIKNWAKYNLQKGGKPILDCVRKELSQVKDISLIKYVGEFVEKPEIKALYDTYDDTSTTRGQKEKEKEKEKEEEKEKREGESIGQSSSPSLIDDSFVQIRTYFDENIRISTFAEHRKIDELLEYYPDPQLFIKAIEIANENGKPNFRYIEGILRNWKHEKGITTYEHYLKKEVQQNAKSKGNSSNQRTAKSELGVELDF